MIRQLLESAAKAHEMTGRGEPRSPRVIAGLLLRHLSDDEAREVSRLLEAATRRTHATLRLVR
jgi:hypothetical protein